MLWYPHENSERSWMAKIAAVGRIYNYILYSYLKIKILKHIYV